MEMREGAGPSALPNLQKVEAKLAFLPSMRSYSNIRKLAKQAAKALEDTYIHRVTKGLKV